LIAPFPLEKLFLRTCECKCEVKSRRACSGAMALQFLDWGSIGQTSSPEEIGEELLRTATRSGSAADAEAYFAHCGRTAQARMAAGLAERSSPSAGSIADPLFSALVNAVVRGNDNLARTHLTAEKTIVKIAFTAGLLTALPTATAVSQQVHDDQSLLRDASNAALAVAAAQQGVVPTLEEHYIPKLFCLAMISLNKSRRFVFFTNF
jgi:hypothetical protein